MKKTKLFTSLITGTVLLTSTPIITTGCSDSKVAEGNSIVLEKRDVYTLPDDFNPNILTSIGSNRIVKVPVLIDDTKQEVEIDVDKITSISINSCDKSVTSIQNNFLNDAKKITKIGIYGCSSITSIGNNFMKDCPRLQSFSIGSSDDEDPKIKTIGDSFLEDCSMMYAVNLGSLYNSLRKIGNNFLKDCKSIWFCNVSNLIWLQSIGDNFMYGLSSLTDLFINNLFRLETIGNHFMHGCSSLKTIDFSLDEKYYPYTWSQIDSIGEWFLNDCSGLLKINMGKTKASTITSPYPFCVSNNKDLAYTKGITLSGSDKDNFIQSFPNLDISPYRKWA